MDEYVGKCPRCRSGLIKKGDYIVCEKITCGYSKSLKPRFNSITTKDTHFSGTSIDDL